MIVCLCFTSLQQRSHLETAPCLQITKLKKNESKILAILFTQTWSLVTLITWGSFGVQTIKCAYSAPVM